MITSRIPTHHGTRPASRCLDYPDFGDMDYSPFPAGVFFSQAVDFFLDDIVAGCDIAHMNFKATIIRKRKPPHTAGGVLSVA